MRENLDHRAIECLDDIRIELYPGLLRVTHLKAVCPRPAIIRPIADEVDTLGWVVRSKLCARSENVVHTIVICPECIGAGIEVESHTIADSSGECPIARAIDIHLDNFVATGGGWLATKVAMLSGGVPQQIEEYSGWKTNVKLDRKLFDPATWATATHWAAPR